MNGIPMYGSHISISLCRGSFIRAGSSSRNEVSRNYGIKTTKNYYVLLSFCLSLVTGVFCCWGVMIIR